MVRLFKYKEPIMANDISPIGHDHVSAFEKIRCVNDTGNEYWIARDLCGVLGYAKYQNF